MELFLKLFLCSLISLGQARQDSLLQEEGTPLNELETLKSPEMMDKIESADEKKVIDIAKLTDVGTYVGAECCNLSTTPTCGKKGGNCVPQNETCDGDVYYGHKYCVISNLKSCKCCVPIDCRKHTLDPCKRLNGTCMSSCNGRSVSGRKFCRKHKTCKCCLSNDSQDCPCGQDYNGGCRGYTEISGSVRWYFGHCKKSCKLSAISYLSERSLKGHKCDQFGAADCNCCALIDRTTVTTLLTTPYATEEPFACGQTNSQVEHDCSGTKTEVIGKNTTWSTSSNIFTSGLTIGILIIPEPGPHDVAVTVDASGYSYGIFKIRLDENTCSDSQGCSWTFRRWTHDHNVWIGKTIPCLPKNEWMLLTITDHYNGSIEATLQARDRFDSLIIPVSLPNQGITIRVDAGNTNLHSEISLDCSSWKKTTI